jgi:hypothetical protein
MSRLIRPCTLAGVRPDGLSNVPNRPVLLGPPHRGEGAFSMPLATVTFSTHPSTLRRRSRSHLARGRAPGGSARSAAAPPVTTCSPAPVPSAARRAVGRVYAAACTDLAQATVGDLPPHSGGCGRPC